MSPTEIIVVAEEQSSSLNDPGFWDTLFWIGVAGCFGFTLIFGRVNIIKRLWYGFLMSIGWGILFIPLMLVGGLFGAVAENDNHGNAQSAPSQVIEQSTTPTTTTASDPTRLTTDYPPQL